MVKKRRLYPPEFRRQMVELVRAGRTAEELSREFEPSTAYTELALEKAAKRRPT